MKKILVSFSIFCIGLLFALGVLCVFYIIDTKIDCKKYRLANPDIVFEWSFENSCYFYLPDGTLISTLEYEYNEKYEIEIGE